MSTVGRWLRSVTEFFSDYVGLALGIVFGLTSTFLANRQPGSPILPWTLLLTFVSVLIDFAKRLKQLKAMAPQQLVRPLGRGNEVLRDVLDLTRGASLVKNTFILFNLSESDALSQGYSEEDLKYIKTSIRDFVHRYGHWHDIVSPDPASRGPNRSGIWLGASPPGSNRQRLR